MILGRRVEAELMKIKAQGEPISAVELAGPIIPDSENGAVIYEIIAKDIGRVSKHTTEMATPAWLDALSPRSLFDAATLESLSKKPGVLRLARSGMPRYDKVISMAEQAVARPKCRFDINWEAGPGAWFPQMSLFRSLARLLEARAILSAKDGDMDKAVRSIELAFKLNESLMDDPSVLGQMTRWDIIEITSRGLIATAEFGPISERQARSIYDVLSKIDLDPGFTHGIIGERALIGLWLFDRYGSYGPRAYGELNRPWPSRMEGYICRPFVYSDELSYIELMAMQIEISRLPYRRIKAENLGVKEDMKRNSLPIYAIVSKSLASSSYIMTAGYKDSGKANIYGSQVFLALLAYKDRFGAYPESLGELRTKLGWDIHEDPFSGKDFVYKSKGDRFFLYSIGVNLRDDGGERTPRKRGLWMSPNQSKDDIVWRMER